MMLPAGPVEQSAEQLLYARILEWGTRTGLTLMVLGFAAYAFGLLPPLVPLTQLPDVWSQPVGAYLRQTQAPSGWGWLAMLGRGDIGGILGVAVLAGCSLPGLAVLVVSYLKRGDTTYALLCGAQIVVLAVAASGWLRFGA